jgi:hypothetical protein
MYQYYDYDIAHIEEYLKASRTDEGFNQYIEKYILNNNDHTQYLKQIGIKRLLDLRADPYYGYSLKGRGEGA